MVAAISEDPLTSSNGTIPRRPKGRQVSSRYMSHSPSPSSTTTTTTTTSTSTSTSTTSSSSRRFPSPLLSHSTNSSTPLLPKRSQSVDRRRPRPATPLPEAAKLLVTSTRSLSVSFQGEAFSLPVSKTKAASATPTPRKAATPERRRATPVKGENSRPADQHRWPARTRHVDHLSKSVDIIDNKKKVVGNGNGNGFGKVVRALQQSMVVEGEKRRASFDGLGGLSLDLGKAELLKGNINANNHNKSSLASDLTASDTDSVSSGSTSGAHDSSGAAKGTKEPRGIVVSARFWQETNSRLRRLQDPGSPLSTSPASRIGVPNRNAQLKRYNSDGPMLSPRTMASPVRGNVNARPASPSKLWAGSSPSRGVSPARVRSTVASSINSGSGNTPSILSFSADVRRGKIGEDRIFDAHTLRLLYNRYVQWRFVNARADATFMVQKLNAERHLWNAWVTISELRHSVILKRIKLVLMRQKLKLTSILKGQISYLEEWALLDRDHSTSLLGATEALKASTLRLPVVEKAIADVPNLKDALGSAVDVMQAMASSIYSLSSKF
ncbi:QWRF motif-containing protein 2 isoform X3 [Glycine max]|uniref:QWRF motif-containing protein 2 isoform C n=1 Tax=Glycine soja TaxID=3848 RepID=A0A445IST3_GLYSO|nr:QWRF motif-containing protein 2 isoform X3 [Glycine max]RZB89156.1 QWRF motif-containing protein 2 isoform C [Glycine soja]|eukprot:XP_014618878.1 QWRF motif-containing protein 2 isoform X3 [Glycine max]